MRGSPQLFQTTLSTGEGDMDVASYEAGISVSRGFGGEDGADCDLAEWPAERVCDLTRQ